MADCPQAPTREALKGMTLGQAISCLRSRVGWSQRELIEKAGGEGVVVGFTTTALPHWERDRRTPSPLHLLLIVRVLNVQNEDFQELLEAAAVGDPLYEQSALLVRTKTWDRAAWEEWAGRFQPRAARKLDR